MTVCEVCHSETARYRCPRCDRRSCRSDKSALLVGSVWAITYAYFLYYLVCLVLRNTRKFSVAVERETKRATFPFQSSPMRSCVVVSWTHGFFYIFMCILLLLSVRLSLPRGRKPIRRVCFEGPSEACWPPKSGTFQTGVWWCMSTWQRVIDITCFLVSCFEWRKQPNSDKLECFWPHLLLHGTSPTLPGWSSGTAQSQCPPHTSIAGMHGAICQQQAILQ